MTASRPVVGLVLHPSRDDDGAVARVLAWAASHAAAVVVREVDAGRAGPDARTLPEEELAAVVDAVISLGGDGTMLGALRLLARRPVPVLGINTGHLGFLVEVDPARLDEALDLVTQGRAEVEPRPCLRITVTAPSGDREVVAFNDVALVRQPRQGVAGLELSVDDATYGYYRADGLVVATPAGSTAYSWAAGGPAVSPAASAMVLTPVAPMQGVARSLVLGGQETVGLRVLETSGELALEVDGTDGGTVGPGAVVTVRLEPDAGLVVRLDRVRHDQRGRVKLSLLDLPLLPEQLRELLPEGERARFDEQEAGRSR